MHDFGKVGLGTVYSPGHVSGVALGLQRELGSVVGFEGLDEMHRHHHLGWWG